MSILEFIVPRLLELDVGSLRKPSLWKRSLRPDGVHKMQSRSPSQRLIGIVAYLERAHLFSCSLWEKLYPARRLPFSAACRGQRELYRSRLLSSRGNRWALPDVEFEPFGIFGPGFCLMWCRDHNNFHRKLYSWISLLAVFSDINIGCNNTIKYDKEWTRIQGVCSNKLNNVLTLSLALQCEPSHGGVNDALPRLLYRAE